MELGDREKEMDMLRQELKAVRGTCKTIVLAVVVELIVTSVEKLY
jgi:hypothetical protein